MEEFWMKVAGSLCAALLFGLPAFASFAHARGPRPFSLRMANFALGCGFLAIVLPEMVWTRGPDPSPLVLLISAVVRFGIVVAGIILAVVAFVYRGDGGVSWGRPLAAGIVCLFHLAVAGVLLLAAVGTLGMGLMDGGTPWTYQAPDGAFSITLPSQQWEKLPDKDPDYDAVFVRRRSPAMRVNVLVKRQQPRSFYTLKVKQVRDLLTKANQVQIEEGPKDDGPTYTFFTGWETTADGKTIFIAGASWWLPDKKTVVTLFMEGHPVMLSDLGKSAEKDSFLKAAKTICLSVR